MTILSFTLTLAFLSLFIFVMTQPNLRRSFDLTVKKASRFKVFMLSLSTILSIGLIFIVIYLIQQTSLGVTNLQNELTSNHAFIEELKNVSITSETSDQLTIPLFSFVILSMLTIAVCFYLSYVSIYLIISEIVAFKYQNKHNDFKMLLSGMANKNASKVADAYYEMKNNKSKSKLFIDQWDEVVKVLLLIGEIQEAEQLNMYLHERSKALNNIPKPFFALKNRNKVALYDDEQLRIDKNDAAKIKHMSYRQMLKNTLTK